MSTTRPTTRHARQLLRTAAALPLFVLAPVVRPWHLHWGARPEEVRARMAGDDLVPVSHFTATRAITISAPPEAVWPWVAQVGFGRGGFYSYDLIDNLGRPSADRVLARYRHPARGDLAAPMADPPSTTTSFVVAEVEEPHVLVWSKPDSSWSWVLSGLPDGATRLRTRLKQRYQWGRSLPLTLVLIELGDFAMMRRMLLGLKERAEAVPDRIR